MNPPLEPYDLPLVVAHRGGALLRAENSASAFELCINSGIRALETDLQMSEDGKIFCWHDDDLSRIGHPKVTIWESHSSWLEGLSLAPLGTLDRRGETLLSLDGLLKLVGTKPVHLFLELKTPPSESPEGIRESLIQNLLSSLDRNPCGATIISFDTIFLRMVRLKRPELPIVFLVNENGPISTFNRWGCSLQQEWTDSPDLVYTCRKEEDYRRAHQKGASIWMCDHPLEARRWHP